MNQPHLLLVYNADAGIFSSLTDFVHKIVSPSTYNCRLCQLTFGNFAMKQEWKKFLEHLPAILTFLHRDEFQKQYGSTYPLPAVFLLKKREPVLLLSDTEINACSTLLELQSVLLIQLTHLRA